MSKLLKLSFEPPKFSYQHNTVNFVFVKSFLSCGSRIRTESKVVSEPFYRKVCKLTMLGTLSYPSRPSFPFLSHNCIRPSSRSFLNVNGVYLKPNRQIMFVSYLTSGTDVSIKASRDGVEPPIFTFTE